jgi:uncharacterized protein
MHPCVGIGWRHPHYAALLSARPVLGFLEVHSENFFAQGGATLAVLQQARECYDISLHGVGLSLGSAVGIDVEHLEQLARLVERIEPCRVSDHASFARAPAVPGGALVHANDLLPIAFTQASLDILVANVMQVQERLKRPILVENLSAYVAWQDLELTEPEFFNQLTRRTGCGLLLDVNNLVVNGLNEGGDAVQSACAWVDQINARSVGEIHLAGYCDLGDIVIDDHGSAVHPPVWQVFRHALRKLGAVPTLVEWDTDIPALSVLLQEAETALQILTEECV